MNWTNFEWMEYITVSITHLGQILKFSCFKDRSQYFVDEDMFAHVDSFYSSLKCWRYESRNQPRGLSLDCPQSTISLSIQYFLWRKGDALLFLLGDLFSFSISPMEASLRRWCFAEYLERVAPLLHPQDRCHRCCWEISIFEPQVYWNKKWRLWDKGPHRQSVKFC